MSAKISENIKNIIVDLHSDRFIDKTIKSRLHAIPLTVKEAYNAAYSTAASIGSGISGVLTSPITILHLVWKSNTKLANLDKKIPGFKSFVHNAVLAVKNVLGALSSIALGLGLCPSWNIKAQVKLGLITKAQHDAIKAGLVKQPSSGSSSSSKTASHHSSKTASHHSSKTASHHSSKTASHHSSSSHHGSGSAKDHGDDDLNKGSAKGSGEVTATAVVKQTKKRKTTKEIVKQDENQTPDTHSKKKKEKTVKSPVNLATAT
jgi:hypothetical protein